MSKIKRSIKALQEIAPVTHKGNVKEIDLDAMTCTVEPLDGPLVYDVQMRAVIDNDPSGILIYPKVGSFVLISPIEGSDADFFISAYSKVDKVEILDTLIHLGGDQEPVLKGNELILQLMKEKQRMDTLLQAITSAATTPQDGGASLKTSIVTAIAGLQSADYSNSKSSITFTS